MADSPLTYLDPIETRNRGDAVLDALAEMVTLSGLSVGDRLPPEIPLSRQLGVGRSTIREALNRWEALGIIRRQRGVGPFIAAPIPAPGGPVDANTVLEGEAILRVLEVRRTLETAVCRLAADRATPEQRRRIDRLGTELLEVVARGEDYRRADIAFHTAISEASANPIFTQLLTYLDQAFEKSKESPFNRAAFGVDSLPYHRELADAVMEGDSDGAEAAVEAIISTVQREVELIIQSNASPE